MPKTLVASLILLAAMPVTALWLIGLMLGMQLISVGTALSWLAWQIRKTA